MHNQTIPTDTAIASIGIVLGDRSRAAMLHCLMKGPPLTARQLAAAAGITPQTASTHLSKLTEAKLIVMEKSGRHRFFRLANPGIVLALKSITMMVSETNTRVEEQLVAQKARHWRVYRKSRELAFARSCYDHLAGRLGVAVTNGLVAQKFIKPVDKDYRVSGKGRRFFKSLGIEIDMLEKQPRHFARACSDWTEDHPHLAGALGKALMDCCLDQRWISKIEGERHVHLTQKGAEDMPTLFQFSIESLWQNLPGDD